MLAPFWRPGDAPKDRLWVAFKESLPPRQRLILPSDTYWHLFLKLEYRNVAEINRRWGTHHDGIPELTFPLTPPVEPAKRDDWNKFVVRRWPRRLLGIPVRYAAAWRHHVRRQLVKKHEDHAAPDARALEEAGRLTGRTLATWDDLPFFSSLPDDETLARYWSEFTMSGAIPADAMTLDAPETRFRAFLKARYGGGDTALAKLNMAWKTEYASFDQVPLPVGLADYAPVRYDPWSLRLSFMTEAYERVAEYILGRGRAAVNTFILVSLSLVFALTINPMAAYSLSRFPMKHSTKILIFFLATMAFPAEVAMIPNFLLLRDLGLLNTFAALVLPRMANGFAIFLLKGFFDSLPQELYHAAEIDGASEIQVFRMIAMPLIAPILAYIGLSTFVMSYSSFMWAFVICPNEDMWTLMVWVYDFQTRNAGNNYVMAATVLVCIPPLIVFFFANRIIMRGIIIPSMK
jgi:multiple sugar transport system permease protein